ncbi:hypothetical protein G5V58_15260 [Nocardioides anomalus]|uniref:Uncharacterized protein n=1 Tax=Nocardioides anomalus TaxID=2712223 RepID=A0A6G6WFL1_9ACTN|nr:hypothetical protein [Nocardioides anomalus]QIG43947.1 hypothetical protein G5V58_15260 [Nocardioides anomalus]
MSPLLALLHETRPRLLLRAVVLLAPPLALLSAWPAEQPGGWLTALVVVLAAGAAVLPESWLAALALGVVLLWWALQVADALPVTALLAALLLVAGHLAGVLLAYGPTGAAVTEPVARLWVRRGLLVGAAAPVVWLLALAVRGQPEPPGVWVAGLVCGVLLCVVAAVAVGQDQDVA